MSKWIISSARLAVSRQADEAVARTTTDGEGTGAGRVAGGRVAAVARVGSLAARTDPTANPSSPAIAKVMAQAISSQSHRQRRGALT
jgi:hypothetical protein